MDLIAQSLAAMGTGQVLLATVFLASYGLALGKVVSDRGRWVAIATAILSAGGFASASHPWEAGLLLIALVPLGMALLAAAAWTLWQVATWHAKPVRRVSLQPREAEPRPSASPSLVARVRTRLRFN